MNTTPRKFYIGDKVLILAGPHAGNHMLICGIAEDYIAGGIGGITVKIPKQFAQIVSR